MKQVGIFKYLLIFTISVLGLASTANAAPNNILGIHGGLSEFRLSYTRSQLFGIPLSIDSYGSYNLNTSFSLGAALIADIRFSPNSPFILSGIVDFSYMNIYKGSSGRSRGNLFGILFGGRFGYQFATTRVPVSILTEFRIAPGSTLFGKRGGGEFLYDVSVELNLLLSSQFMLNFGYHIGQLFIAKGLREELGHSRIWTRNSFFIGFKVRL